MAPGSGACSTVAEQGNQQGLQAMEQLLALGSGAQLHTEQAQHGGGQGLFFTLPYRMLSS